VGRPRKSNRKLPRRVYEHHGAYRFLDYTGRWHTLCRVEDGEPALYNALAKIMRTADEPDRMPEALVAFKLSPSFTKLTPNVRVEHGRIYDKLASEFADFRVAEVEPFDVVKLLEIKWAGKPTAQRHVKARLSSFFRWCVARGLRKANPCREVWIDSPPMHKVKWSDESFHRVRDALLPTPDEAKWRRKDGRLRDDVRAGLMLQTYMDLSFLLYQRATDVRLLRWSQVRDGVIHFEPTKTAKTSGAEVDIPITPEIAAVLEGARSLGKVKAGPGGDAFVVQTRDGGRYTRYGIRSALDRAAEKAGYTVRAPGAKRAPASGLTAKDLRPYAAKVAKRQGYSIEQLQVALAHTSVTTTEGYARQHITPVSAVTLHLPMHPDRH
jgi:integrase